MFRYFRPGKREDRLDFDTVLYSVMIMGLSGRIIQARKSTILTKETWVVKPLRSIPFEQIKMFTFLTTEELDLMIKVEILEEVSEVEMCLLEL